ncbi:MAG: hypothetical protein H0T78_05895 [Longispora sp.]|nr:hypothetical protein [Longispora sp. (in: high G+C Gram-positive bacteria)]
MSCDLFHPQDCAAEIAKQVSQGVFQQLEEWLATGAANVVKVAVTGWVAAPSPTVNGEAGPAAYLAAYTSPVVYFIFFIAMLFALGRMAWTMRGEEARELLKSLLTYVFVTGAGASVVAALTTAGDSYSNWILAVSTGTDPNAEGSALGTRVLEMMGVASPAAFATLPISGPALVLLGALVSLSGLLQIALIYIRAALLVLLVGLLPLAAASALSRRGRHMLERYAAWVWGWVLFKPAAATIYAAAFWMISDRKPLTTITGLMTLFMALFALPALMRLFVPMAAALGGGGGLEAGAALGGAVATGAVRVAESGGSSASESAGTSGMPVRDATHGASGSAMPVGPDKSAAAGAADASGTGARAAAQLSSSSGATTAMSTGAAGSTAGAGAAGGPIGMAVAGGVAVAQGAAKMPSKVANAAAGSATGAREE